MKINKIGNPERMVYTSDKLPFVYGIFAAQREYDGNIYYRSEINIITKDSDILKIYRGSKSIMGEPLWKLWGSRNGSSKFRHIVSMHFTPISAMLEIENAFDTLHKIYIINKIKMYPSILVKKIQSYFGR